MSRTSGVVFVLGVALFWSFFSYAVFPVGGTDQALVDRSSVIARSLLLALLGAVLALGSTTLVDNPRRIRMLKGVLIAASLIMLAAALIDAPPFLAADSLAIDAISALHIALLAFCWGWAADGIRALRLGVLLSISLLGALAIALLARILSDTFPVSEPSLSALMPFLSSACFLAIPARSTAPSTPRVPLNHVFSGPLGIMLVTLALYDVGSAVFRNGYTQGSIAYESIHGTAASWIFSCLIAGAVVGYAWWLQRKGKAIETAWVTLALACLISLYLIALLSNILPAACNALVLSTRFLVIVATWVVIVTSARGRHIPSAPLISALFLPLVALSRLIIYGPWQLSDIDSVLPTPFVILATTLLTALFLMLLIIGYASRQLQKNTLRDGSDNNASNQRIEEYFKSQYALTQREYEILELLARGYSQKKIAEELVLSVGSVQSYSKAVYRKLHIHSKQEAIDLVDRERGSLS